MRVEQVGKYFKVLPSSTEESKQLKHQLMGWRQRRNDPWITAEYNMVNCLVLNIQVLTTCKVPSPYYVCSEKLENFQVDDVSFMSETKHCLNANPMGLGKTVETIEALKAARAQSVCIVTPKIIRTQWVNQIKRWWGRDAEVFEGQKILDPNKIYVVNYDKLRNDKVLTLFKRFRWDYLVLDEAHKIKNRTSKQTLAVKEIPCTRRVALTGTPILRYVDDLWSILNFLHEFYSGRSYWSFTEYFCKIEKTPWGNKIIGTTDDPFRLSILKRMLSYIMVRHDAIEVAQGKTYETVRLAMSKPQRDLYRKEKQLLLDQLPENCTIANGAVLAMRLRQTVSWPGLFLEKECGPKFEWILEMCNDNPSEKFVVFTVFENTARALQEWLCSNKIRAVSITGKNSEQLNQLNKSKFITDKAQVLIGTIGAMGQGYDELQNVCRIGIFVDRDWSPEINKQAEERLHRMGQQYPVHIVYLECQGSFDQHIGRINVNKANGIREALENED